MEFDWTDTLEVFEGIKRNPEEFLSVFNLAISIKQSNYDLGGWIKAFSQASLYGFISQYLIQTQEILSNPKNELQA